MRPGLYSALTAATALSKLCLSCVHSFHVALLQEGTLQM